MFTVGGGVFTVGGGVFTVGGAHKRGRRTPINGTGDNFFLGHSYFPSVSDVFTEKNGSAYSGRST